MEQLSEPTRREITEPLLTEIIIAMNKNGESPDSVIDPIDGAAYWKEEAEE